MIGVVDYGLGNIPAFLRVFNQLNVPAKRVTEPEHFGDVDRLLLPGVGAFDWAMRRLTSSGLREELEVQVSKLGKPVLGVCVGMQILFDSSSEGSHQGLGWLKGNVERVDDLGGAVKLPHMGWNLVHGDRKSVLLKGLEGSSFYFLHSYQVVPRDHSLSKAFALYGNPITAVVECRNIMGTQFHPEKSHGAGLRLLGNFAAARVCA